MAQDNYRNWIRTTSDNDKLALVIGNTAYEGSNRLPYARKDARLMTATLEAQGYDVLIGYDLDLTNFKSIISDFADKLYRYEKCVMYYAGHSLEGNGINYMVPIGADLNDNNLGHECVTLESIMKEIDRPSIPKLFLLDACRVAYRSGFTNKERDAVRIRKNVLIIYSTVEGTRVKDNNPFAEDLSKEIAKGGCIERIFKKVSRAVNTANPDQQIWQEGSLEKEFCFEGVSVNNDEGSGTFEDTRDGEIYRYKRMKDGKIWMTQNLNYKIRGSYCYEDKKSNCQKYGRLYMWKRALNVCPKGWRLPTDNDWKNLLLAYGGYHDSIKRKDIGNSKAAYKALMSVTSGFTPVLGGERDFEDGFNGLTTAGSYWSATEKDPEKTSWYYSFSRDDRNDPFISTGDYILRFRANKHYALSCRCVKD